MKDIMFICGKCGNEVDKEAEVCNRCGAKLGNIRCPFCRYTGSPDKFKNDRCPKCGKNKNLSINYTKKKSSKAEPEIKNIYKEKYEEDDFLSKYFPVLFFCLLLSTAGVLVFFLKYFNFF